jgi:glutaminyl-peptide cyclotransferase
MDAIRQIRFAVGRFEGFSIRQMTVPISRSGRFLVAVHAMAVILMSVVLPLPGTECHGQTPRQDTVTPPAAPANAERIEGRYAMQVLQYLCELGPRISGSPAMATQQQFLKAHFEGLGATVTWQEFEVSHPVNHTPVPIRNLLVQFHPDRKTRILICCHYDTRPFPDKDTKNPTGVFLGANDGASGVGLLCELGLLMPALESEYGVDFVFFDAEEFIFQQGRDQYFLGSRHFASQYIANPPEWRYACGVLVDMIGDAELNIYLEKTSVRYARNVAHQIWDIARQLGIREFLHQTRHEVRDDHLPLNEVARIPTVNIIDFDYPSPADRVKNRYWHTQDDTPDKCSAESLGKVGSVILSWLQQVRMPK